MPGHASHHTRLLSIIPTYGQKNPSANVPMGGKSAQTLGEHADSPRRDHLQDPNLGPRCCEATVLTPEPP